MSATKTTPAPLVENLSRIAATIHLDFHRSAGYYAARPYVLALMQLDTADLNARYGQDGAADLVRYLLGNLQNWRGQLARETKAQLNAALAHFDGQRAA